MRKGASVCVFRFEIHQAAMHSRVTDVASSSSIITTLFEQMAKTLAWDCAFVPLLLA